jgi:hypothetical protein
VLRAPNVVRRRGGTVASSDGHASWGSSCDKGFVRTGLAGLLAALTCGCSIGAPSEPEIFGEYEPYRPPVGAYSFSGKKEMSETFSTGGADGGSTGNALPQSFGPSFVGTVTARPDRCWEFFIDHDPGVASKNWERVIFCPSDGNLLKREQTVYTEVVSIGNTTSVACNPPNAYIRSSMNPGDTWNIVCSGTNTVAGFFQAFGTYQFVGREDEMVAGRSVSANHFTETRTIEGDDYGGTQITEWWFRTTDALPLRLIHDVNVTVLGTPLGDDLHVDKTEWSVNAVEPAPLPVDGG